MIARRPATSHDTFGIAGAARRVLEKRDILGTTSDRDDVAMGTLTAEHVRRQHVLHGFDVAPHESTQPLGLRNGDEQRDTGVVKDADLASQMILELGRACRWVHRHGHAAGQEDPDEGREVIAPGRQHEPDRVARQQVPRQESRCDVCGIANEVGVGHFVLSLGVAQDPEVEAVGVSVIVPRDDVEQCRCAVRGLLHLQWERGSRGQVGHARRVAVRLGVPPRASREGSRRWRARSTPGSRRRCPRGGREAPPKPGCRARGRDRTSCPALLWRPGRPTSARSPDRAPRRASRHSSPDALAPATSITRQCLPASPDATGSMVLIRGSGRGRDLWPWLPVVRCREYGAHNSRRGRGP